jgi:hypothetical protein
LAAFAIGVVASAAANIVTVPSTAKDAVIHTTAAKSLSTTGGAETTIISVILPAGSWVISATVTLVNFGPSDYTRCQIVAGTTQIGAATTMVGNPTLTGAQGSAPFVATLSTMGAFKTSAVATTVNVNCSHDHSTPPPNGPGYVDPLATLHAQKSASLVLGTS